MSQNIKVLDLAAVKAKQALEDAGEWYNYDEGGSYLVAFIGREDFARRLNRLEEMARQSRPDLKKKDSRGNWTKKLPAELSEEIGYRAMFGTLVLGWKAVGDPCEEFTEDNFVAVMQAVRGLGNAILEFSSERENYRAEQAEQNLGK